MRIAVMGTGGVGGYFGARLAVGGQDVSFIARGKQLEALRRNGLRHDEPGPHADRADPGQPAPPLLAEPLPVTAAGSQLPSGPESGCPGTTTPSPTTAATERLAAGRRAGRPIG